jgi:2-C-methyl-D-erythritol 4-phosphate cytidylyltransferase
MGTSLPKQFLPLAGRPVLMHTIEAFRQAFTDISLILVLPADQLNTWSNLCQQHGFTDPCRVVTGGDTRYQSVKNGLTQLKGDGFVGIHDGVRPLIRPETIRFLFEEAKKHLCAIPVISPSDSLRWQDETGNRVINRDHVKIIQTPQVFELNKLKAAYVSDFDHSFTDDATVWENAGNQVYLTKGQTDNIKITGPDDLIMAEALLAARNQ